MLGSGRRSRMNAAESRKSRLRDVGILLLLVMLHLGIVASVAFDERPLIWPLHNDTIHRAGRGVDFYAVYHAAMNLQQGRGLYSEQSDGVTPYWYPFRYLPVVAVIFQPFTQLPPQTAHLAWLAITELVLAALVAALWRYFPASRRRLFATGALLLSSPYFLELYMGQFTFVTTALCYLGLLLPWGAALLSVSVVLKNFPLVAFPALVRQPRYWGHGVLAMTVLFIVTVPHFLNYPRQWEHFARVNFRPEGGFHAGDCGFLQLLHLAQQDVGAQLSYDAWLGWTGAFRLALLAATAGLVLLSRQASPLIGASALLLAHFVTYQHVWEHHFSGILAIGAVLLLSQAAGRKAEWTVMASMLVMAAPTLFGMLDTAKDTSIGDPSIDWPRWASYVLVLPKVAALWALYAVSAGLLLRSGMRSSHAALSELAAQLRIPK